MDSEHCPSVAIVIPVFNRRETTLLCLRHLMGLRAFTWARAYVVDDASKDGTADAVRAEFPEVRLISGDGNLWWGGGINLGTHAALADGVSHVFWLNDDCLPEVGVLEKLYQTSRERGAVATAVVRVIETGISGLGGWRKTKTSLELVLPEGGGIEACDTFSGNCVCIPRVAFEKVGVIDTARYPHSGADTDIGFRIKRAGIPIYVVGDAFCNLSDPPLKNRSSWLFGNVTIADIWRTALHPQAGSLSASAWHLRWTYWGFRGVLGCLLQSARLLRATVIRLVLPQSLLRKLFGRFSHTHRVHTEYAKWLNDQGSAPDA